MNSLEHLGNFFSAVIANVDARRKGARAGALKYDHVRFTILRADRQRLVQLAQELEIKDI